MAGALPATFSLPWLHPPDLAADLINAKFPVQPITPYVDSACAGILMTFRDLQLLYAAALSTGRPVRATRPTLYPFNYTQNH